MKTYKPTIGLEIHAELKTQTKMFCDSKNSPHAEKPNSHICPVCMGHPGTLPLVNKEAVRKVLMVGIALGGKLASYTEFDRKNYFYPDIPKGYQISQYKYPLVSGGVLCGVDITRVHLEEDTARSLHDKEEGSIIDFNRAGVPLMELVTEPVVGDSKTAGKFAKELQLLLRTLGVSDANMEKGEMRVEANISVSTTEEFGTKVEVKNLNSFKSVESAIEYEIKRQVNTLENNKPIFQETRGWDESGLKTFSQRKKESSDDYRYFPDPDIPKMDLTKEEDFSLSRLEQDMPILPDEKRKIYTNLGLTIEQIEVIISDRTVDEFFSTAMTFCADSKELPKITANYLISDLLPVPEGQTIADANAEYFVDLLKMIHGNEITSRVAKDILFEVVFDGKKPKELVESKGLAQDNSEETLGQLVQEIISENPDAVAEYKGGKETAVKYLVGQGMKKSRGSANPQTLLKLFEEKLS